MACPLHYRHVEELMQEHGLLVDHSMVNRWVLKYTPQLEEPPLQVAGLDQLADG
jgi:transposase-like protein